MMNLLIEECKTVMNIYSNARMIDKYSEFEPTKVEQPAIFNTSKVRFDNKHDAKTSKLVTYRWGNQCLIFTEEELLTKNHNFVKIEETIKSRLIVDLFKVAHNDKN